jgi:ATP-binding cassette subfamily F protein 2
VWLEDYLATYKKILVVISHSQDFLNGVCTDMMVMQQHALRYWSGNYDAFLKTKSEQDVNTIKLYKKQQGEIAEIKAFIASCGTYANLVRQAKSRQKILDKMEADGLLELPFEEPVFRFKFNDAGDMAPPLISFSKVAFSYSGKKKDYLFTDISFGIHPSSRIVLVGPNGAGERSCFWVGFRPPLVCVPCVRGL